MLKASFTKHTFQFKRPGGTSRGVLTTKDSWYIKVYDTNNPLLIGIGECSIIKKLSIDDRPDFEEKLGAVCSRIDDYADFLREGLTEFPSIHFGLETALLDLNKGGNRILFSSDFSNSTKGIPINGLVWMGDFQFMKEQIVEKIDAGYRCIKLKIGAIHFEDELRLLKLIRNEFDADELELRVDANGAFSATEALDKLSKLSEYDLHSIEQPIRQGQWEAMAGLCDKTPLPIALDEELIGISDIDQKHRMLAEIHPQFIILKPSLLGGFAQSLEFIKAAEMNNIGWWITSALEGNIGLNAVAQWTATLENEMPQGLGTGQLFTNNVSSPLQIDQAKLYYKRNISWDLKQIMNES